MKNLKVSAKLLLGFGSVIVFIIVLGITAFVGLGDMNQAVQLYSAKTVPNTRQIGDIGQQMVLVERYLVEAVATVDDDERAELMERILAAGQDLADAIDVFNQNARSDPALMEAFQARLESAQRHRQSSLTLLQRPHTPANQASALNIYKAYYVPACDEADVALHEVEKSVSDLAQAQDQQADQAFELIKSAVFLVWMLSIACAAFMTVRIRRSLLTPLRELRGVIGEMSRGVLNDSITYQSRDEYGALAGDLKAAVLILRQYIGDIQRAMKELSDGNFDVEPTEPFVGDFKQIEDSVGQMILRVCAALAKIDEIAGLLAREANQVSTQAQALAQGAEEQAGVVQELSASAQEVYAHAKRNTQNTEEAQKRVVEATELIQGGNEKMQELVGTIRGIDARSNEIRKISKTIEDIAFQTNILALNAAVEAARAGSAGKGFAVVADEVRNLAVKSAEAAKNAVTLIEDTIATSALGVTNTELTAQWLGSAVTAALSSTDLIGEITAASVEQAHGIEQMTMALEQFSAVIQNNSASSEESAATSEDLLRQAQLLKSLVGQFRLKRAAEQQ